MAKENIEKQKQFRKKVSKKKKERKKEIPIPWCSSIYVYLKITDFAK